MSIQYQPNSYICLIAGTLLLAAFCATPAIAQPERKPIEEFRTYLAQNEPLRVNQFSNLREIRAKRDQLQFSDTSGQVTLNLLPYFESPSSIARTAAAVRALGIDKDSELAVEVFDFPDRIIVKQELNYKGSGKACAERPSELREKGVLCFQRNPNANLPPGVSEQEIRDTLAEVRDRISSSPMSPIIGYTNDELVAMSDEGLFGVLLNDGRFSQESYLMTPKVTWKTIPNLQAIQPSADFALSGIDLRRVPGVYQQPFNLDIDILKKLKLKEKFGAMTPTWENPYGRLENLAAQHHDELTRYLVNGFTWYSTSHWAHRFGSCIDYWVGKACAYAEPRVDSSYGLGVRIPLRVDFAIDRRTRFPGGQLIDFKTTIDLTPLDGDESVYEAAETPPEKLFDGKEVVAEANATVGLEYNILGFSGNPQKNYGVDLTDYLDNKGNIAPPEPGGSLTMSDIWSPDLAAGYFDYGVVGSTFHIGAKLDMNGKGLAMAVQFPPIVGANEGKRSIDNFPATYNPLVFEDSTFFLAYDPVYDASWSAVPGVRARAYLDVWVYSASKNFDYWLTAYAIETPDFRFRTHEGTIGGYQISADNDELKILPF